MHKQITEKLSGIYEINLYQNQKKDEIHVYLVKGNIGQRSLLIDTGYNTAENRDLLDQILTDLHILPKDLDIFLTHKHHDHTGMASYLQKQGASLYMNPLEDRHLYDCLYYGHGEKAIAEQNKVLTRVGVTPERNLEVWNAYQAFNAYYQNAETEEAFKTRIFSYLPIEQGQTISYGDYTFQTISLPGHTLGQLGLCEEKQKLLFSGDQIISNIVPIVGTSYPNEHLLTQYFRSLGQFKTQYSSYTFLPAHGESFNNSKPIAEKILSAYRKKLVATYHILENSAEALTVQEIAFRVYGVYTLPPKAPDFFKIKSIITKTFSCLEYLYEQEYCTRMEQEGMLFYR